MVIVGNISQHAASPTDLSATSRNNEEAKYMSIDDLMKKLSKNQGGQIIFREVREIMANAAAFLLGKPAASPAEGV